MSHITFHLRSLSHFLVEILLRVQHRMLCRTWFPVQSGKSVKMSGIFQCPMLNFFIFSLSFPPWWRLLHCLSLGIMLLILLVSVALVILYNLFSLYKHYLRIKSYVVYARNGIMLFLQKQAQRSSTGNIILLLFSSPLTSQH